MGTLLSSFTKAVARDKMGFQVAIFPYVSMTTHVMVPIGSVSPRRFQWVPQHVFTSTDDKSNILISIIKKRGMTLKNETQVTQKELSREKAGQYTKPLQHANKDQGQSAFLQDFICCPLFHCPKHDYLVPTANTSVASSRMDVTPLPLVMSKYINGNI